MYYNKEISEVLNELQTNQVNGLTKQQVKEKQEKYGLNELKKTKKQSLFIRFLLQFKDTLTIILLIAAIVSIIVEPEEWVDSLIILVVVTLNAILGVVQESNAEKSLDALQKMSSPKAKVKRDGQIIIIDANQIVPGDLLILEAGDLIASDGRVIEAYNFKVDESALTGESVPVEKTSELIKNDNVPLAERQNMVHASCIVTYGRAVVVVTSTGMNNEVGKIATMIMNEKQELTPLQIKLDQIGKSIGIMAIVICIVVFLMEYFSGLTVLEAFKTSIALAVAAIPEGLATVVTIVLAMSVQKMVKKNAIIRQLPAVETLGSTSIVCSDKTGTLTQNKMTVMETYTINSGLEKINNCSEEAIQMLNYFTLCSDASINQVKDKIVEIGDPTETALVKASLEKGYSKNELLKKYHRKQELAFDSDRKMMSVFYQIDDKIISITKGGPDVIFKRCLNKEDCIEASKANEAMAKNALRVLAVGYREWNQMPETLTSEKIEENLTFIGLVGMIDPPRKEAKEAVKIAKQAGVKAIMITGDHITTACAIAKDLGILEEGQKAMTGTELSTISDAQLMEIIEDYSVYARVAPEHKVRIVNAWQAKGKVVAMTGDGVNDSPALKTADIGCAMGITGTDVAKGAAAMILTDDNFATIISSIEQGRGIYDNIKKDVQFLLSTNIGEVVTIFLSSFISLVTPYNIGVPLLPIHLLWVNLITDSLPAFALGMEPIEKDVMKRMPREKDESFFANHLGFTIVWQGIMVGALTLIAYLYGNHINHETGMTMAFITLSGVQLIHAFNVKSHYSILNKSLFNNIYLWGALLIGVGLQVLIISIPFFSDLFKLVPITPTQWLVCICICLSTVVICELVKLFHRIIRK
ncbi:MAG: calcium-translocating P-type ATPase, PMCA-type [Erysipelotrichaceae bacterium]|nr:calcium-translocating P-type ATPase, PMCA-type [Erysipelotrichaceae bacterium]